MARCFVNGVCIFTLKMMGCKLLSGYLGLALADVWRGLLRINLVVMLSYHEVKLRYQRSILGPLWITISMGVMVVSIGVVFGGIFKTEISEFLPFLASGLILWTFITGSIVEGCSAFISDAHLIRQIRLPYSVYVFKVFLRNFIILGHNALIIPLLYIVFDKPLNTAQFLFLPGIFLFSLNVTWIIALVALISTRYRDMQQIISSMLQVFFYISPIIWSPSLLQETDKVVILKYNPIYYLLDIVRSPVLSEFPNFNSWIICFAMFVAGSMVTLLAYNRKINQLSYWV